MINPHTQTYNIKLWLWRAGRRDGEEAGHNLKLGCPVVGAPAATTQQAGRTGTPERGQDGLSFSGASENRLRWLSAP